MLKKIILWTLYAAFVGVLIFGAVNRTTTKIGNDDGVLNGNAAERELAQNLESGQNGQTYGQEDAAASQQDAPAGYDENEHEGQVAEHEWMTLTGTVSSILPRGMFVAESDGQHIEITRRPWRFAQEQGFAPQVGDQVTLDGFYENEEFEAACLTDLTNGQIVYLRDDAGHPLWADGSGNGNK
ncbi:MAG: hypothetical protein ISS57_02670 [Anaerolineales bacterium]|nr:hypothetical protein [Anaerolineales bacterium]